MTKLVGTRTFWVIIGYGLVGKVNVYFVCAEKIVKFLLERFLIVMVRKQHNTLDPIKHHLVCYGSSVFNEGMVTYLSISPPPKDHEDKSKEKRLEDVPVIQEFPEVFPEDLPGTSGATARTYGQRLHKTKFLALGDPVLFVKKKDGSFWMCICDNPSISEHVFCVSSNNNNSSTNGAVSTGQAVNTANGVSTDTQVNASNIDNLSDAVICAFLASQPNNPQLAHEDLQQSIHMI
ncbi:hypothetical protein Tco_0303223 [Tanacetum coccineum]